MARFNEFDEQAQQQWYSRVAQKRQALSASVEEALKDASVQEEQEAGETGSSALLSESSLLISPQLGLQSKSLPGTTSGDSKLLPAPAKLASEAISTENANILTRFAQRLTSSGSKRQLAIPAPGEGTQSLPKIDGVPSVQPVELTMPAASIERSQVPPTPSTEVSASIQRKQHAIRRTTKVRLQVVPKPEEEQRTEELPLSLCDASTNPNLPVADRFIKTSGSIVSESGLSGSGTFENGQSEVAIANEHIAPSSVVFVMLAGDPGPVVVQYVSLQPQMGFTVHLSAPTTHKTPFNYVLLNMSHPEF